ncbi:hypothetical protein BDW62DRAFT_197518 [Aspergillus aurantiobrunneus]
MVPRYALPDSQSDPDQSDTSPQPSDKELERALRETVAKIFKTGKTEELTVKRVRLAAEKALQIEEGFFKSNGDWKARSDEIIKDEVEVQDNAAPESWAGETDESAGTPPSNTGKATKRAKPKASSTSHKRRKLSTESKADSGISDDDSEGEATKGTKEPKARAKVESELSEKISSDSDAGENQDTKSAEQKAEAAAGDSESEMSVVLDEEPQPKRQRQKKSTGTTTTKVKKKEKKAPAKAKDADADPNQAEIKRLQGWLLKCGIRKMWARELAPYDTPKSKIKHLKDMLKEVGMEGRYSLEKARQIKEQRELREDLEMVQEGAKRWGKSTAEDDSDSGQPRRRLNRGRQSLAFLESEGEETD